MKEVCAKFAHVFTVFLAYTPVLLPVFLLAIAGIMLIAGHSIDAATKVETIRAIESCINNGNQPEVCQKIFTGKPIIP